MDKNTPAFKVYERMMQTDYCSQWMDLKPIKVEEGHCELSMIVRKEMLNGYGILHGGIAYAMADSAFAFASNSYGRIAVSITGTMNYCKSAKLGDKLIAVAEAKAVSYKIAEFDVNVFNESKSELMYTFRGIVYRKSEEILTSEG